MTIRKNNLVQLVGSLFLALTLLVSGVPVAGAGDAQMESHHEIQMASDMDMSGHCASEMDSEGAHNEDCCDSEPCECVCLTVSSSFVHSDNINLTVTAAPGFEIPDPIILTDQFSSLQSPPPIILS